MPTASSSLIHRIRFTPMRDVLRGRLTGRLDYRSRIDSTDLPEPAKALVKRVVKRTRLWRLEKVDVADELMAHFADGLDSGASIEELSNSFGDGRRVARLIRRAKKRNRPLAWHAMRYLGWTLVALVVCYAALLVRFIRARPSPTVNYLQVMNRPIERLTPQERAWPLYRRALLLIGQRTYDQDKELRDLLEVRFDGRRGAELKTWLDGHREAIELLRQASRKPALGFILGPDGSVNDPQLYPETQRLKSQNVWDDSLVSVSMHMPYLNDLGIARGALAAEARLARDQRDAAGLSADVVALLDMARQMQSDESVIGQMCAIGTRMVALEQIDGTLVDAPKLLSEAQLRGLAHLLVKPDSAAELIRLDGERLMYCDSIQRMYTDDGRGSGHLTFEGLRFLRFAGAVNARMSDVPAAQLATLPAVSLVALSRRDVRHEFDRMFESAEARLARPIREADWATFRNQMEKWRQSRFTSMRYAPLTWVVPSLEGLHMTAERYLGKRDGVLVGIALELYRRQQDQYPARLELLTPALLPRVPVDRITGEPLLYRIVEGHPVVYSAGTDLDDDGGKAPLSSAGAPDPWRAANWVANDQAVDGDWVLYPEPRSADPDDD